MNIGPIDKTTYFLISFKDFIPGMVEKVISTNGNNPYYRPYYI